MARARLAGEQRSRAIIEATLGIFAREGFAGATTRRIAAAAGVSEALVFKHFPTKDSLYRAIIEGKIREIDRTFPLDDAGDELDDEAWLTKLASSIFQRVEADDAFLRLMVRSALDGHDLARDFHRARTEKVLALIERRIRTRGLRRRAKERVDPAIAARLFNGMVFSTLMSRRVFGERVLSRASRGSLARTLARTFLKGIDG